MDSELETLNKTILICVFLIGMLSGASISLIVTKILEPSRIND